MVVSRGAKIPVGQTHKRTTDSTKGVQAVGKFMAGEEYAKYLRGDKDMGRPVEELVAELRQLREERDRLKSRVEELETRIVEMMR